jgi:hypothetical protein
VAFCGLARESGSLIIVLVDIACGACLLEDLVPGQNLGEPRFTVALAILVIGWHSDAQHLLPIWATTTFTAKRNILIARGSHWFRPVAAKPVCICLTINQTLKWSWRLVCVASPYTQLRSRPQANPVATLHRDVCGGIITFPKRILHSICNLTAYIRSCAISL